MPNTSGRYVPRLARCLTSALALAFAIGLSTAPAMSGPVAPVAVHPKAAAPRKVSNPHLHGAVVEKTSIDKTKTHHWKPRWDYAEWMILHRGLGTVQGFVQSQSGTTMEASTVVLRHPGGQVFKNAALKHLTMTDTLGHFNMLFVRAGKYRVVAESDKAANYEQIHLHPGEMLAVNVRI